MRRAPLDEKLSERASVHQNEEVPAPPHEDQQDYAAVRQGQRERAPLDPNPAEPGPLSQGRQTRAHYERDYQARASVRDRQKEPTPPEHATMPHDQPEGASVGQRGPAPLQQNQQEPASLEETQRASAPLPEDQRAPLQGQFQERASAHQEQRGRALLNQDQPEHALLPQEQRSRAHIEEEYQESASVQEDRQEPPSEEADRQASGTEAEVAAATLGTMPQEITLHLATLPFEGAEPTGDTAEQLAALAERLLREPALSVAIEAEFEAPDPAARTEMERRVEVVRAILVRRGIAPMRLVVRPAGHDPVAAPATSLRLEPRE
jgi:hypothetical protein